MKSRRCANRRCGRYFIPTGDEGWCRMCRLRMVHRDARVFYVHEQRALAALEYDPEVVKRRLQLRMMLGK